MWTLEDGNGCEIGYIMHFSLRENIFRFSLQYLKKLTNLYKKFPSVSTTIELKLNSTDFLEDQTNFPIKDCLAAYVIIGISIVKISAVPDRYILPT